MIFVGILTCLPQVSYKYFYFIFSAFYTLITHNDVYWSMLLDASDPVTNVFATTTRDHPIHLWDATSGQVLLLLHNVKIKSWNGILR